MMEKKRGSDTEIKKEYVKPLLIKNDPLDDITFVTAVTAATAATAATTVGTTVPGGTTAATVV